MNEVEETDLETAVGGAIQVVSSKTGKPAPAYNQPGLGRIGAGGRVTDPKTKARVNGMIGGIK